VIGCAYAVRGLALAALAVALWDGSGGIVAIYGLTLMTGICGVCSRGPDTGPALPQGDGLDQHD
jgi:hypothetical protein